MAYGSGDVMNLLAGPMTRDLPKSACAAEFKGNFKAALRVMDKLNTQAEAEGDNFVVYGITHLSHLKSVEYAALYATGVLSRSSRRRRQSIAVTNTAAEPAPTTEAPPGRKLLAGQSCPGTGNVPYQPAGSSSVSSQDTFSWIDQGRVGPIRD